MRKLLGLAVAVVLVVGVLISSMSTPAARPVAHRSVQRASLLPRVFDPHTEVVEASRSAPVLVSVPTTVVTTTTAPSMTTTTEPPTTTTTRLRTASTTVSSTSSGGQGAWASWYQTPWGGYTFANRSMPFGTRVEFSYHGRSIVATCEDRGPFVAGREFDLSTQTAGAIDPNYRSDGVIYVMWRYA